MSEAIAVSKALSPAQILARLKTVAGQGSGLDADLVTAPAPRSGGSFGGFPNPSSTQAMPIRDPSATLARFNLGA